MALRIAWACHPRNVNLGIAANVFVYVGTIILYVTNWFFTQRIVRAQHAKFGWSKPYFILHRLAEVFMVASLILIVVSAVWTAFTLDPEKLRIFRVFQLTGQTYFTFFCFAPIIVVGLSLLFPRHAIDKFGVGRLRINITILIIAVIVLSVGQIFRCVITWIPPYLARNAQGQPVPLRWYHSKASFYIFNFVTEIIVLVLYAIARIDLRFHVPNGSRMSGDYSARNSRVTFNNLGTEKTLNQTDGSSVPNKSNHSVNLPQSNSSIFDDSHTLADSLSFSSPTLRTKHASGTSFISSTGSTVSPDRITFMDSDIPPVPQIPAEWPLPTSPVPPPSEQTLERNTPRGSLSSQSFVQSSSRSSNDPSIINTSTNPEPPINPNTDNLHPLPLSWSNRPLSQREPILPSNPNLPIHQSRAISSPATFNPALLTPDGRPQTPVIQSTVECKTCNGIIPIAYLQPEIRAPQHQLDYELSTLRPVARQRDSGTQTSTWSDSWTQTDAETERK